MHAIDPGHLYSLDVFDGEDGQRALLQFVKREGPGYPFNVGHGPGTNCQEVLRALIDRTEYLQRQIPSAENIVILNSLRSALLGFEIRAARRHGRELEVGESIEAMQTCDQCGHIGCAGHG